MAQNHHLLYYCWLDHRLAQTQEEAFSEVRNLAGTTQVDFEVDRPPPAGSPPRDLLINMVKETVNIYQTEFWKNEKKWNLFVSLIDLIVMKTLLTAKLPVTNERGRRPTEKIFRQDALSYLQADMCSAPYSDHNGTHLTRALVVVDPRSPPKTNVGTETAFRHDQGKHIQAYPKN